MQKYTDPSCFGPGLWFSLHLLALEANDQFNKKHFIRYAYLLSKSIKCENCRVHYSEFLEKNPPDHYWAKSYDVTKDIKCSGLFYWTWDLHNSVNGRIGKQKITLLEAYRAIVEIPPCTSDCGIKI